MSKRKKALHIGPSAQGRLFDSSPAITEGELDMSMAFRDSLSKALRGCRESRWQIAARISEAVGRNISKDMLDKYTSSNSEYGYRAEDLTAFCLVTGTLEPFRTLLSPLSSEVIDPEESKLVRLARLERKSAELEGEMAKLRSELGIRR